MRKIPTLFQRDEATNRKHVLDEVTPGCEWVLQGEGIPTRKYDGTAVLIRRDGMAVRAFARREVKPGKATPPNFVEVEHDDVTGKTVGWEPADQSGFAKFIAEAIVGDEAAGTYELIGPKVQGNPERSDAHRLVRHDDADVFDDVPRDFVGLGRWLHDHDYEGIVWWRVLGDQSAGLAKLKRKDFPWLERP